MVDTMARKQRSDAPFIAELEAANFHPVWDRFKKITPLRPQAVDAQFIWHWRDIEPLLNRAVAEVPIEDIERRAIIMVNPAFGGETVTTSNLIAAFTVLDPGDRARPHRHTFAAIRFATQSDGAATIVNGRRCEMKSGDLILTPPMCWHGHINDSDHRIFWFDAANLPLIRALGFL
jgi:gentisate 1,2-dioxygenase